MPLRPPFLPKNHEEFAEHVAEHSPEWFKYCQQAYDYIARAENAVAEANEQVNQSQLQLEAVKIENANLRDSKIRELGVREYQDEQLQKLQQKLIEALKEKDQAISLVAPTVNTPRSSPVPILRTTAEEPVVTPMGAPPSIDPPFATSAHLSERLPDPDKFEGDRKDLRRFVAQIHDKMTTNRDRFPTPQSRMSYVNSRLKGLAYAQILPYTRHGACQLDDYEKILNKLERAFGDPNRVQNACDQLFRLRQGNKEFSVFYAEFQRLALEGELADSALPTLLKQAINRELKGMMLHQKPPRGNHHQLAEFLQDLENQRLQFESATAPRNHVIAPRPFAPALTRTHATTAQPVARNAHQTWRPTTPTSDQATVFQPDPMDLSSARQLTRKTFSPSRRETGACFRCGSHEHRIRDCPHPDNRPQMRVMSLDDSRPESLLRSPPRGRTLGSRSPSPTLSTSVKGVSLA